MNSLTRKRLTDALAKAGAPLFKGELNVTLVGVRSADKHANAFNDTLCVFVEMDGKKTLKKYPITTDPGTYYREHPVNVEGTAVLVPGHYKSCWQLGAHRGQYRALVQRGLMDVYRDNNKNARLDFNKNTVQRGFFGINLHRAGVNKYTLQVDRWSAGCQVMQRADDFNELMDLLTLSASKYGDKFSYTLLDGAQL